MYAKANIFDAEWAPWRLWKQWLNVLDMRAVSDAYRMLLEALGQITIVPHGEMFEVTNHAASLQVQV